MNAANFIKHFSGVSIILQITTLKKAGEQDSFVAITLFFNDLNMFKKFNAVQVLTFYYYAIFLNDLH